MHSLSKICFNFCFTSESFQCRRIFEEHQISQHHYKHNCHLFWNLFEVKILVSWSNSSNSRSNGCCWGKFKQVFFSFCFFMVMFYSSKCFAQTCLPYNYKSMLSATHRSSTVSAFFVLRLSQLSLIQPAEKWQLRGPRKVGNRDKQKIPGSYFFSQRKKSYTECDQWVSCIMTELKMKTAFP